MSRPELELQVTPSTYLLRADGPTPIVVGSRTYLSVCQVPSRHRRRALHLKFATYPFLRNLLEGTGSSKLIDRSAPYLSDELEKIRMKYRLKPLLPPKISFENKPHLVNFAAELVRTYFRNIGRKPSPEGFGSLIENIEGRSARKIRVREIEAMTWTRIFTTEPQLVKTLESLGPDLAEPKIGIGVLALAQLFSGMKPGTEVSLTSPHLMTPNPTLRMTIPEPLSTIEDATPTAEVPFDFGEEYSQLDF